MSCQPYSQWWISPPPNSLLKTDHLVSLLLFLLPSLALFILPLLLYFFFSCHRAFYLSFAFAVLLLLCCDLFSSVSFLHQFSLHFSMPFSCLQSWMTHVYDPYKGTHLFSAHPILSVSLLLVFSLLCSTCLHTSTASPRHTAFCPFNILHRWRGHCKLQYPLNPSLN